MRRGGGGGGGRGGGEVQGEWGGEGGGEGGGGGGVGGGGVWGGRIGKGEKAMVRIAQTTAQIGTRSYTPRREPTPIGRSCWS